MNTFSFNLSQSELVSIGNEQTKIIKISNFFDHPEEVVAAAASQSFAHINPHYPGIRAAVEPSLLEVLCSTLSEAMSLGVSAPKAEWMGQAWYSIVTRPAQQLTPIQRLPHFDGFDPTQLAIMIYLDRTAHGGTAFYRQISTGYEHVTEPRFPEYKSRLEQSVRVSGLPPAAYITDGAPHFDKIYESDAAFNSLIIYPGTILHSGVIRNDQPLSADPVKGRLTVNGFFRPKS